MRERPGRRRRCVPPGLKLVERAKPLSAWEELPDALRDIREAIERSRTILQLACDWDGEGGLPISETTWVRSVEFVARQACWFWEVERKILATPDITPVPDGSIDLHWDRQEFELLVNIPVDASAPAGFYGDDRGVISIKGQLDTARFNEGLALWLTPG